MVDYSPESRLFNELIQLFQDKQFKKADQLLSEHPTLSNYKDGSQRRAAHYAALTGHLEFLQHVLKVQPELCAMDDDTGWTMLMLASSAGYPEVVRLLLSFPNVDVNHRNTTGQSALHYACSKNHMAIVQALIDNGADLNAQDERGATPLHRAAGRGHQRIVNLLIGYKRQLQMDLQNREGDTPLHLACEDEHEDTALFLVRCGANLERENNAGRTPLDITNNKLFKEKLLNAHKAVPSGGF